MKKKLLIIMLVLSLSIAAVTATSFAEMTKESPQIETVDQLKAAMAVNLKDGSISIAEKRELVANSTEKAIGDLIEEKLNTASVLLNGKEMEAKMQIQPDGSEYAMYLYDLGDGCTLMVELQDCAEIAENSTAAMLRAASGGNEQWKEYGNRYFTAKASVKCNVGTAYLNLENHYVLSPKGIDENFGVAGCNSDNAKTIIAKGIPKITDGTARTPGGSDVNLYCNYTVKELTASGTQEIKSTYKLNTTVKYLAVNKTGEKIKVGQMWSLQKT